MSKESVTVAGIDCGTNSIRLKIARVDADGMHEVVPRILRVIRLGQDVDKTHRFADEALERAYVAAREFAGVIAEHPIDGLRFVATSATRDAENREEFEDEIERILGVRPEVIPGTEEADLSFLGATSVVNRDDLPAPYLVVDLGGGSTELVIGGDGVSAPTTQVQGAFSMNIGSVRMTERHLTNDPPTQTQIDEAVADVDEHIDEAFRTVDAGIHPGRIDVVGGGAVVWSRVLARVSEAAKADHGEAIDSFVASEHGLLDGIVLDYGRRLLAQ